MRKQPSPVFCFTRRAVVFVDLLCISLLVLAMVSAIHLTGRFTIERNVHLIPDCGLDPPVSWRVSVVKIRADSSCRVQRGLNNEESELPFSTNDEIAFFVAEEIRTDPLRAFVLEVHPSVPWRRVSGVLEALTYPRVKRLLIVRSTDSNPNLLSKEWSGIMHESDVASRIRLRGGG